MKIDKETEQKNMKIAIGGRLDTNSAPQLETELKNSLDGIEYLEFDFTNLEYIASSGLRILLTAQKVMNRQGKMVIKHANETIKEVFELTGFADIMDIE